jgi:hypothetical protein
MSTPYESAQLNLKLFELRRDPLLRQARDWFISQFHPESFADFAAAAGGKEGTYIRMVVGYWSMAASLAPLFPTTDPLGAPGDAATASM